MIGNDTGIGTHVKILSNVAIGYGAVIRANSVISKDVPPFAIAVGNPIEIKKYRFSSKNVGQLLAMKWGS